VPWSAHGLAPWPASRTRRDGGKRPREGEFRFVSCSLTIRWLVTHESIRFVRDRGGSSPSGEGRRRSGRIDEVHTHPRGRGGGPGFVPAGFRGSARVSGTLHIYSFTGFARREVGRSPRKSSDNEPLRIEKSVGSGPIAASRDAGSGSPDQLVSPPGGSAASRGAEVRSAWSSS
jgi:hypothetical protein